MINLILNRKIPGKIDVLDLDATIEETEEYINNVTEFPVETGFAISDHVVHQPEKVVIQGFITNSPIPNSLVPDQSSLAGQGNRVLFALEKLIELSGFDGSGVNGSSVSSTSPTAQLIDVQMGLRSYSGMIIERLTVPRDRNTGEALNFTIELRKLRIASTKMVKMQNVSELNRRAPNAETQGTPTANKDIQQATEATPDAKALLLKLLEKLE